MKDLIRLTDLQASDVYEIFNIADEISPGKHNGFLNGKSVVLFFPASSIRTRVTFEKGIYLLGGQPILFPCDTLDKREELRDVFGYLNNWADIVIIRHKDIQLVEDKYLFCGKKGNIGLAWKEASEVMGFELSQCCGAGYEMEDVKVYHDIETAVKGKDIICTDSLSAKEVRDFRDCQVTKEVMDMANKNAVLNPCPPFYRGEEVSDDVIQSEYFVGYEYKKSLLVIQQAVMIWCMGRL